MLLQDVHMMLSSHIVHHQSASFSRTTALLAYYPKRLLCELRYSEIITDLVYVDNTLTDGVYISECIDQRYGKLNVSLRQMF